MNSIDDVCHNRRDNMRSYETIHIRILSANGLCKCALFSSFPIISSLIVRDALLTESQITRAPISLPRTLSPLNNGRIGVEKLAGKCHPMSSDHLHKMPPKGTPHNLRCSILQNRTGLVSMIVCLGIPHSIPGIQLAIQGQKCLGDPISLSSHYMVQS
jgi:hypothetical protein